MKNYESNPRITITQASTNQTFSSAAGFNTRGADSHVVVLLNNNSIDDGKVTEEDEEREMSGKEDQAPPKPVPKIPSLKAKMHQTQHH